MRVSALFLLVTLGVVSLASCSKIDDDKLAADPKTTIAVINAGPDTLNIYQKGTRLNSGSNLLPGGQYKDLEVSAGTTNFQFKKLRSAVTLIDAPFSIDLNKEYTMFVAGQSADKVFLLQDDIPTATPDSGIVRIRFVNASPIEGTLDVTIGNDFDYKNLAFKSATQFVEVSSGKQFLSIRRTGDTTQIAKGTLTLANRYTYTLYTKGLLDGTGTGQFGARILVVKQN